MINDLQTMTNIKELSKHGVPTNKINEILEGYHHPQLSSYGYSDMVDYTINYIVQNDIWGENAVNLIDETIQEWGETYANSKFFSVKPKDDYGILEKMIILAKQKIPIMEIMEILNGYSNDDLIILGYRDVINTAVKDVYRENFKGNIAANYIKQKIYEWNHSVMDDPYPVLSIN